MAILLEGDSSPLNYMNTSARELRAKYAKTPHPDAPGRIPPGSEVVKIGSHRAREKLTRLLGLDKLPGFIWYIGADHGYAIPRDRLADALKIKGVTRYSGWQNLPWRGTL